jgi:hypothetical protein
MEPTKSSTKKEFSGDAVLVAKPEKSHNQIEAVFRFFS